ANSIICAYVGRCQSIGASLSALPSPSFILQGPPFPAAVIAPHASSGSPAPPWLGPLSPTAPVSRADTPPAARSGSHGAPAPAPRRPPSHSPRTDPAPRPALADRRACRSASSRLSQRRSPP